MPFRNVFWNCGTNDQRNDMAYGYFGRGVARNYIVDTLFVFFMFDLDFQAEEKMAREHMRIYGQSKF